MRDEEAEMGGVDEAECTRRQMNEDRGMGCEVQGLAEKTESNKTKKKMHTISRATYPI